MSASDRWEIGEGRGQDVRFPSHFPGQDRRRASEGHREVVVRVGPVVGSKAGLGKALAYITHHGHSRAVDQDGQPVTGPEEVRAVSEEWAVANDLFQNHPSDTQAVPIVLSMPAGADRDGVEQAARAWAEKALRGFDWVAASHDDTDNPHVHVLVRSVGIEGNRFRAGPPEIRAWRESFADELRARGIEATATARQHRLINERQIKSLDRE